MNRFFFILIVSASLTYGCSDKTKQYTYKPVFTSFEISFNPGMGKKFSLLVDSSKIYFAPQSWETCFYGVLQDSIIKSIDSFCLKLKSTYKTIEKPCYDCSDVAFKTIIGEDTFRVHQLGEIDKSIFEFINFLETNVKLNKHKVLNALVLLETTSILTPLPPKIEKEKSE